MREIQVCPSLLVDGFSTYCPKASRMLFDGRKVSPWLDFNIEDELHTELAQRNMQNLSISGAQEKLAAVIDGGRIRLAKEGEQSTHILKPAPVDMVSLPKQIPMNEHLTMQIASQVYGIPTAANGLCFSADGQPVYITRRFDVQADGTKMAQEDFRRFGLLIGLPPKRVGRVLSLFMELPASVHQLIQKSFLFDDSTRRKYSHIVEERVKRFVRAV